MLEEAIALEIRVIEADLALQQMRTSWSLRYDDGTLNALDENGLDEGAGLGGDAFRYTLAGSIINGTGEPRLVPMGGVSQICRERHR